MKDQVIPKPQLREGYKVKAIKGAKKLREQRETIENEVNSNHIAES